MLPSSFAQFLFYLLLHLLNANQIGILDKNKCFNCKFSHNLSNWIPNLSENLFRILMELSLGIWTDCLIDFLHKMCVSFPLFLNRIFFSLYLLNSGHITRQKKKLDWLSEMKMHAHFTRTVFMWYNNKMFCHSIPNEMRETFYFFWGGECKKFNGDEM